MGTSPIWMMTKILRNRWRNSQRSTLWIWVAALIDKSQDFIGLQKLYQSMELTWLIAKPIFKLKTLFISSQKKAAIEAREEELNTYHNCWYDPVGLLGSSSTPIQNGHTTKLHELFNQFNSEQREAFNVISAHLLEKEYCKTEQNPEGQLRMFISGEGGTGKCKLVEAIVLHARMIYGHDGSQHGCVLVVVVKPIRETPARARPPARPARISRFS